MTDNSIKLNENDTVVIKSNYINDKKNGLSTGWYIDGSKRYEVNYENDQLTTIIYDDGNLINKLHYK